jgi:hypothetical protein
MSLVQNLPYKLLVIGVVFMLSGCFGTMGELPDRLDKLSLPIRTPKVSANQFDVARFNSCMAPLSLHLKDGFIDLIHSVKNQDDETDNPLLGNAYQLDDENMLISEHSLHPVIDHIFEKLLGEVTFDRPLGKVSGKFARFNQLIKQNVTAKAATVNQEAQQASTRAKDYLIAYFTKGTAESAAKILQDESLKNELAGVLKRKSDDPAISKALDLIDSKLTKISVKEVAKSQGFIARDGSQFSFPGIGIEDSHVVVDHNQVGADIVRILLEAVRDTYAPLPVVASSTALATHSASPLKAYALDFDKADTATIEWQFDRHHAENKEKITLTKAEFEKLEANARKAEAFVATTVGKVIRGGSWGALNNEAVAKLVETLAGVVARHSAERAQWCAQAQIPR